MPAAVVGSRELKTRLGRYLNRVRCGETIVVTDPDEPVAELRSIAEARDPAAARLAKLAATGGLTLPTATSAADAVRRRGRTRKSGRCATSPPGIRWN